MSEVNPAPEQSKKHPYQKLGGWLLVFVIVFFLQGIRIFAQFDKGGAMGILRAWSTLDGAQGWLLLAGQVISVLLAVIYAFTAIAIIQRDPGFLRTRQHAFLATALDILIQAAIGLFYGFGGPLSRFGVILQAALFPLSVLFVTLYYTRSVRVRTYMGTDEYLRLALFTKKKKGPRPAVEDEGETE